MFKIIVVVLLNMERDPVKLLLSSDVKLAQIIRNVGKYSIEVYDNPFESLIRSIIYQQLTGNSANAIFQRFTGLYGNSFPTPNQIVDTKDEILRKIGLSYKKIAYVKDLSTRVIRGELILDNLVNLSDEQVVLELIKVKGIGRWTAEMFLIFCLKREDVLPLGDLGIKKAIKLLYDLDRIPSDYFIISKSIKWRPYRSIAAWYLWKSLNSFTTIG
jgi:DNA-3-methyladenine glycosylase II